MRASVAIVFEDGSEVVRASVAIGSLRMEARSCVPV